MFFKSIEYTHKHTDEQNIRFYFGKWCTVESWDSSESLDAIDFREFSIRFDLLGQMILCRDQLNFTIVKYFLLGFLWFNNFRNFYTSKVSETIFDWFSK